MPSPTINAMEVVEISLMLKPIAMLENSRSIRILARRSIAHPRQ